MTSVGKKSDPAAVCEAAGTSQSAAVVKQHSDKKVNKKDGATSTATADKKLQRLRERAHKPTALTSLRHIAALRSMGEVIDDNGVIIRPADGERKVYNRSGRALIYDPDGDSWLIDEQSGQVDIVKCDDGTVYIRDIISNYRTGAWMKGTLTGNTITIATGQLVNYESTYDVPYAVYWGKKDGRDYLRNDERDEITFTIDDDRIVLDASDEDNIVGIFYEYENTTFFSNWGDYESVYAYDHDFTPLEVVTVTPPANLPTHSWYTRGHFYEGSSVPFRDQVTIGFDGNDIYLQGLFSDFPQAWMHGVIDGETVMFNGLQLQGESEGKEIYAIGYNGYSLTAFEMTYDAESGMLQSVNVLLANGSDEDVDFYTWIEDITITSEDPFRPIEVFPYQNGFQTLDEQEAFTIIDANGDHDTWDFAFNSDDNYFARYTYNESFDADDWLISPAFLFEAGKQYRLTFDTWNKQFIERIEVLAGNEATPQGMTLQVVEPTDVEWEEPQEIEAKISVSETGVYYIGFHAISSADQNKLFVDNVMVDVYEMEAPAAPTNFSAVQTPEILEVTINLNAPTVKRNGDPLLGNLDKVELMRDGVVIKTFEGVAPGAALTWIDATDDLSLGLHRYQAVAYNDKGAGDKTEEIVLRLVATLNVPYTADFTVPETIGVFEVIDANQDGSTWNWSDGNNTNYEYNADNAGDDYLITPPINLVAGKNYNVIVNAFTAGAFGERFEVLMGSEPTPEALTTLLIEPTEVTNDDIDGDDYEALFSVNEDGKYYIAIHAISDADMYRLILNYLTIEDGAEPSAPAAPAISVNADENGARTATVTVTASASQVDGAPLTGVTRIVILRDGVEVGVIDNVAPGATVVYNDEPDENGFHTYQAIPYNESGRGMKSDVVTAYVGLDAPLAVENLTATDNVTAVTLNWDKVGTQGVHDGYVDPATVDYVVWSSYLYSGWGDEEIVIEEEIATVTDADTYSMDFNTDDGEQHYEYWVVEARNEMTSIDDNNLTPTGLLVGAPYMVPVVEGFANDELHYFWETNGVVMISPQATDGDESALALLSTQEDEIFFNSGKLDLNGLNNPTLLFDVAASGINSLNVLGSVDGQEFTVMASALAVNNGYTSVKIPLNNLKDARYARIAFSAYFDDPSEIDDWDGEIYYLGDVLLIDNIRIVDLYQNDLSVALHAPESVLAGNDAALLVTVTNEGENAANGYNVVLTACDKELLNVTPNQTLAPFTQHSFEAVLPTSVLDEAGDVFIAARVVFDPDEKLDNNEASTSISIIAPALPTPTDLVVNRVGNNAVLGWLAPDTDGAVQVTEDFEDTAVFPEFSLGGITADVPHGTFGDWTLYDGNGLMTYGFSAIEVPNLGDPMAWMPFNPSSTMLAQDMSSVYVPHSGNQFMLSTCVSDGDPIPATDHWLISPELMGNAQTISFFARAITDSYGFEEFEVLYSTTDTAVGSFISLGEEWFDDIDWVWFSYDLPEGAKYFAIRHTATDIFGLLLDDITFEREATAPIGYNVYVDGQLVGNTTGTTFVVPLDDLDGSEHWFAVTAVYEGGKESSPVTAMLDTSSAINEILASGEPFDIYTIDGRLVRRQATSFEGLKGIYLVGNKKVLLK